MTDPLTSGDRAELDRRGIPESEVRRQLAMLAAPPAAMRLVSAATVGDGIHRLDDAETERCLAAHAGAARAGRLTKFVPASGAASRMFRDLVADTGDARERLWRRRAEFPFAPEIDGRAGTAERDRWIETLLERFASSPKGLIPFHGGDPEPRTPFDEHLDEAVRTVADGDGRCRVHFTVAPVHRRAFAERLAAVRGRLEADGARLEVSFSEQSPATDTVAIDADGAPLRDDAGRLVFRPGGHGALIRNLDALDADLVLVKNIDNVQPAARARTTHRWKRVLAGLAARLVDERARRLAEGDASAARRFLRERFFGDAPDDESDDAVLARLDRPLRVAGVVVNSGEPGGGPFRVLDADGRASLQIVETAQIDRDDPAQERVLASSTHFNPVDLVCALRAPDGSRYPLERFVDPRTSIVTEKSVGGRPVRALERPGLWNGAMAGWLTAFVEVPLETFSPVKTVFDLLRDEHRG